MNTKDTEVIEEEIDNFDDIDEEIETIEEELDEDDDIDYDEDGNVIIDDDSENEEQNEEENTENEGEEESPEQEENPSQTQSDEEHEKTKNELENLKMQVAATLKKLGVDVKSEDLLSELEGIAAEADGITVEEYRANKSKENLNQEAVKHLKKVQFDNMTKQHIDAIHAAYPETAKYKTIFKIPNFKKFSEYADKGIPPKDAFAAANPDLIAEFAAKSTKQKNLNSKEHLVSSVPKGAKGEKTITMSKKTLQEWKDMFPQLSTKEVIKLYKDTL